MRPHWVLRVFTHPVLQTQQPNIAPLLLSLDFNYISSPSSPPFLITHWELPDNEMTVHDAMHDCESNVPFFSTEAPQGTCLTSFWFIFYSTQSVTCRRSPMTQIIWLIVETLQRQLEVQRLYTELCQWNQLLTTREVQGSDCGFL